MFHPAGRWPNSDVEPGANTIVIAPTTEEYHRDRHHRRRNVSRRHPVPPSGGRFADRDPIFGDSPEGVDIWQRVPYDAADYGPVDDYATDFDHGHPDYNPRAPEVWKELRESGCPVAHSDRYGGMWVPITHETVHDVAYDTENFTSRTVVVSVGRPGDLALPAPIGGAPPITSDPPFHAMARRLLLPPFAPKQIEPWDGEVRSLCRRLLDEMGDITPGETVVDAAVQYAQHIPVNVIGRMLGFPEEDEELFRKFVHDALERITEEPGTREGMDDLGKYIAAQIEDHRENPRDDLTSYLMNVETRRQQALRRACRRVGRPAAHRRHRHHVVGDRLVAVAPRPAPRAIAPGSSTTPR